MPSRIKNRQNPAVLLRSSRKFRDWNPAESGAESPDTGKLALEDLANDDQMGEPHYTPAELAKMWGVSVQTIRELFRSEEGVLKIGSDGNRKRRAYKTLRVPHSVAERVHTRLSA